MDEWFMRISHLEILDVSRISDFPTGSFLY